jgi:hypothetical protein
VRDLQNLFSYRLREPSWEHCLKQATGFVGRESIKTDFGYASEIDAGFSGSKK